MISDVLSSTVGCGSWFGALLAPCSDAPEDPLMALVRQDHVAATTFLRAVMLGSGSLCSLVVLGTSWYLSMYWYSIAGLDRPLHWWLLINMFIQAALVPVRFAFFKQLKGDGQPTEPLHTQVLVSSFTSTPVWRGSKKLVLASYAWFVLGFVWVLKAGNYGTCPGVYHATVAVILQAILRAMAALAYFKVLFADEDDCVPQVEPASMKQIEALPASCYRHGLFETDESPSCAVCLSEYVPGDWLVILPCKHHYHRHCGEQWLAKRKTCPLCIRPIDESPMEQVSTGKV